MSNLGVSDGASLSEGGSHLTLEKRIEAVFSRYTDKYAEPTAEVMQYVNQEMDATERRIRSEMSCYCDDCVGL